MFEAHLRNLGSWRRPPLGAAALLDASTSWARYATIASKELTSTDGFGTTPFSSTAGTLDDIHISKYFTVFCQDSKSHPIQHGLEVEKQPEHRHGRKTDFFGVGARLSLTPRFSAWASG